MPPAADQPAWTAHLPPDQDPDATALLADHTLVGRWTRRWRDRPRQWQLHDVAGTAMTAEQLEEVTRLDACRLLAAGLNPGDRLLLSGSTSARFVTTYVAALRAGLCVVPMNPAYTISEVQRIVRDAGPAAAAVDDDSHAAWLREASPRAIPITDVSLDGLGPGPETAIDAARAQDPALLVYTSGTTGDPKGALLTHANLLASATAVNLAWRWEPEDCLLLALPLFHVHGLGAGINGSLCAGAAVRLRPRFDAADVAARCREGGISLFFGVPTMYQRLTSSATATELTPLRLLVSGSAPLPAALATEVARQAGQIPLERYGMTETGMLTSNPYDGPRIPGTVGFPLPEVELRLADPSGEVQVRGPNVITGYFGRPAADAESFTGDGWFRTGDLGELDEDGYLRLSGRSKDLIITGGYNVHPVEVEQVLMQFPGVSEVAVVGRASEAWGEEVTAVLVADRRISIDDLRRHAASRLAPYKVPRRIEFADQLPRNALGKVVRAAL